MANASDTPFKNMPVMIPNIASVTGELPRGMSAAMPNTSATPSADPAIDTRISPEPPTFGTKIMHSVTANTEPSDTPSRDGEARSLRVTPCMTAPDMASIKPTSSAPAARGMRECRMIWWSTLPES